MHNWLMIHEPEAPRKIGRPPIGGKPMTQLAVRLTEDQIKAIDQVIAQREGATDRAAVIREAISKGLRAMGVVDE